MLVSSLSSYLCVSVILIILSSLQQISISELHRWPKENAFSFHCWVSLDRSCADGDQRNMRRMLYRWVEQKEGLHIITQWSLTFSFYAGSTGFEAFFTKDLVLVVAVHSKKRGFQTISVKEPLSPQKWVRHRW